MTAPSVSVILPTYNRSWGLHRALRSVLDQSFSDFEVIVADDCSTDDTPEVVAQEADPRVHYARQPSNVGVARNWGAGLTRARGAFVCFLMDDDCYRPGFLARRVEALQTGPDRLCAFAGYERITREGQGLGWHRPPLPSDRALTADEFLRAALCSAMYIGATLYRTDPVRRIWPAVERDALVVDYALNVRLALLPAPARRTSPRPISPSAATPSSSAIHAQRTSSKQWRRSCSASWGRLRSGASGGRSEWSWPPGGCSELSAPAAGASAGPPSGTCSAPSASPRQASPRSSS